MAEIRNQESGIKASWAVREIDQLFSAFARYTKFVVYSKWGLVAIAGLLVLTLIAWPLVTKDKSGLRVSFVDHKSVKVPPSSPVMNHPEYRGVGNAGQEYKVTGIRATQQTPSLIVIDDVVAEMVKANGALYTLRAKRAEYRQSEKRIDLFDEVTVQDNKSTQFVTSHAVINTDTMDVTGRKPVDGTGMMGTIQASGFDIRDNGAHITFITGERPLVVVAKRKTR